MNASRLCLTLDNLLVVSGIGILLGVTLLIGPRWWRIGKAQAVLALSLLLGSALLPMGWAQFQEARLPTWSGTGQQAGVRPPVHAVAGNFSAQTDCGRAIPLYKIERDAEYQEVDEASTYQGSSLVRTGPADPESNCHGWVFALGEYFIAGEVIDDILDDNGYAEVAAPQAGDLIVYRGPEGSVEHTGVVREVSNSGEIFVESKWGSQARYLHAPADQPYWRSWGFYRSEREGHRLAGMDDSQGTQTVSIPAGAEQAAE
jgi:hypothetical protein